jgi:beta-galactosidase
VRADVAVVWDWQSWWALELEYRPSVDVTYLDRVEAFYRGLWDANRTVDFVPPTGDLSGYRLVVVPSLYLAGRAAGRNLQSYVEGGGRLLVSFFSGIVDEHDAVHPGPYPGALRDVLGLTVEEFHPLRAGELVDIVAAGGDAARVGTLPADVWSEAVVPAGCEVVLAFGTGPDAGGAALTRHHLGAGTAWYLATRPDQAGLAAILDLVIDDAGLPAAPAVPAGVEVVRRATDTASWLFLINHRTDQVTVAGRGHDLLTDRMYDGTVPLPPGGVAVLREQPG